MTHIETHSSALSSLCKDDFVVIDSEGLPSPEQIAQREKVEQAYKYANATQAWAVPAATVIVRQSFSTPVTLFAYVAGNLAVEAYKKYALHSIS